MLFTRWLKGFAGRILTTRKQTRSSSRRGSTGGTSLAARGGSWMVTPNGTGSAPEFSQVVESLEERTLLDASQVLQNTLTAFHGEDHAGKDGTLASLGYNLTYLYFEYQDFLGSGTGAFDPSNSYVNVIGDSVVIDARADGDVVALRDSLEVIGLRVTGT